MAHAAILQVVPIKALSSSTFYLVYKTNALSHPIKIARRPICDTPRFDDTSEAEHDDRPSPAVPSPLLGKDISFARRITHNGSPRTPHLSFERCSCTHTICRRDLRRVDGVELFFDPTLYVGIGINADGDSED